MLNRRNFLKTGFYEGIKLSSDKQSLPGPKQVYRTRDAGGRYLRDTICRADEEAPESDAKPLLVDVMEDGKRLRAHELLLPGIGHQAAVVEGDLDPVGVVAWQHLLGAPFPGPFFCYKTIIPEAQEHLLAASGR